MVKHIPTSLHKFPADIFISFARHVVLHAYGSARELAYYNQTTLFKLREYLFLRTEILTAAIPILERIDARQIQIQLNFTFGLLDLRIMKDWKSTARDADVDP